MLYLHTAQMANERLSELKLENQGLREAIMKADGTLTQDECGIEQIKATLVLQPFAAYKHEQGETRDALSSYVEEIKLFNRFLGINVNRREGGNNKHIWKKPEATPSGAEATRWTFTNLDQAFPGKEAWYDLSYIEKKYRGRRWLMAETQQAVYR